VAPLAGGVACREASGMGFLGSYGLVVLNSNAKPLLNTTVSSDLETIKMAKKQSSDKISSLASKVLSGAKTPTKADAKKLAGSVLGQDEKKGKRKS
jgi:hypothetical protein